MADIDVVDATEENRFVHRADGHLAQLQYEVDGDRLVLTHTIVPDELGGRGVAGALVAAALDRARSTGETIAPWCAYARSWMERHPDAVDGIDVDWSPAPESY